MAPMTHKQQPLPRAIVWRRVATARAALTCVVGVHLHRHAAGQQRLICHIAVQFRECPSRRAPIRAALLRACARAPLTARPLADMSQILQTKEALRVCVHKAPTDRMVARLLQPSLSPRDHDETSCRRASAFALQAPPQPGVVVRFSAHRLTGKEYRPVLCVRSDSQIALAYVHPDNTLMGLRNRVCDFDLQTHEQIELLAGLVVPELRRADGDTATGAVLDERHMPRIAGIVHSHTPIQAQDAHLLASLEAVVMAELVGQGGRDELGAASRPR